MFNEKHWFLHFITFILLSSYILYRCKIDICISRSYQIEIIQIIQRYGIFN